MTDAPTTPDPIEMAMTAEASGVQPVRIAEEVLKKQAQLIGWEIADRRAAFGLKLLVGLTGLLVAAAIAWLIWDAASARGLVVKAFSVPPDLAARGMTGQVAASQLLDSIGMLETRSGSVRASESYANDWGRDLEVQIPDTNVSIGEVQRLLRRALGHQTRVEGEIVRLREGVKVTVRVQGRSAASATGSEDDLDGLILKAAESVYATTQPYRYASSLTPVGRFAEGQAIMARLAVSGSDADRPWATNQLGNVAATNAQAVAWFERSATLGPTLALPWLNLGRVQRSIGHTAAAKRATERGLALLNRRDFGGYNPETGLSTRHTMRAMVAEAEGDFSAAIREHEASKRGAPQLSIDYTTRRQGALLALRHEPTRGRPLLAALGGSDVEASRAVALRGWLPITDSAEVARAAGDWPGVLAGLAPLEALLAQWPILRVREFVPTAVWPRRAEALAQLGQLDAARAWIARTPLDCEPCLRVRGLVAAKGGDAAGVDRWYGEAVRLAPDSPFAYVDWGRAKLARGDAAGALKLARQARRHGPKYADAAKLEGDAQAATGKAGPAARAYARAAEFAPRWGGLHLAWGQALARLGKADEAKAKWRAAAGMDLLPAERDELSKLRPRTAEYGGGGPKGRRGRLATAAVPEASRPLRLAAGAAIHLPRRLRDGGGASFR